MLFGLRSRSSLAAGSIHEIGSCRTSVSRPADPSANQELPPSSVANAPQSDKGSLHGSYCALVWLMDRYQVHRRRQGSGLAFFLYAPTTFRNRSSQARAGRKTVKTSSRVADVILI